MRLTQILLRARWELVPGVVSKTTEKYSNLPKSYIRRSMRQVLHKANKKNLYIIFAKLPSEAVKNNILSGLWNFRSNGVRQEEIHAIYHEQSNASASTSPYIDRGPGNSGRTIDQAKKLDKRPLNQSVFPNHLRPNFRK